MSLQIIAALEKTNGRLYSVKADHVKFQLLFTWHSLSRIEVWDLKVEKVLELCCSQKKLSPGILIDLLPIKGVTTI